MGIPRNIELIIESNYILRDQRISDEQKTIRDYVIAEFEKLKHELNVSEIEIVCIESFNKNSIVITDIENEKRYLIFDLYLVKILDIFEASFYGIIDITWAGMVPLLFIDEMLIKGDYNLAYYYAKILEKQVKIDEQWLPNRVNLIKEFEGYSLEEKKKIEKGYFEYAINCFYLYSNTNVSFVLLHEIAHFFYDKGESLEIKELVIKVYDTAAYYDEVSQFVNCNINTETKNKWEAIVEVIDNNQDVYFTTKFIESLESKQEQELFEWILIMYNVNRIKATDYTISKEREEYIRECTCDIYAFMQLIGKYSGEKYYDERLKIVMTDVMHCIGYMGLINCIRCVLEDKNATVNDLKKICDKMIDRLNFVGFVLRIKMVESRYLLEEAQNKFWDEFNVFYNKFRESYYSIIKYKNENYAMNNDDMETTFEQIIAILQRCGV